MTSGNTGTASRKMTCHPLTWRTRTTTTFLKAGKIGMNLMITKLLTLLGLRKDVGAPVHVGANPVYFTYVYELELTWAFSWHDAAHKTGASAEYWSKEE